jgi:hypothetical protein
MKQSANAPVDFAVTIGWSLVGGIDGAPAVATALMMVAMPRLRMVQLPILIRTVTSSFTIPPLATAQQAIAPK